MKEVTIVGAGLAGAEAAWQLACRGVPVTLYEMRPGQMTPAHKTAEFAELVCSNSLRAMDVSNAVGLLKEEMSRLGSLTMRIAKETAVPAGGALAVDRETFSKAVTEAVSGHPLIRVLRQEVKRIPEDETIIIATGPLTSEDLAYQIRELTGAEMLSFFDAAAPIVEYESIDLNKAFWASRYDKGDADYLNCPLNEEEYRLFFEALTGAATVELKDFEKHMVFEGCMPIEIMAQRGYQTMAYGPLKPVGLKDPRTKQNPYAVVQLRKENIAGTLFNMVGFQTHLKWGEQKRVFRLIPGLEQAEFARYGVMHRNTFLNAPQVLRGDFSCRMRPGLFFAGQITGVEGYVESAASGLLASFNVYRFLRGEAPILFPAETALGGLARHLTGSPGRDFQPMNIAFGLIRPLDRKVRPKKEKNRRLAERALSCLEIYCQEQRDFPWKEA